MKKILAILMATCLCIGFCACGGDEYGEYSEEDKILAEEFAEQRSESYFDDNYLDQTYGGSTYSSCFVTIVDSKFSKGKYLVTVKTVTYVSGVTEYNGIDLPVAAGKYLTEYTLRVSDGVVYIIDEAITTIE